MLWQKQQTLNLRSGTWHHDGGASVLGLFDSQQEPLGTHVAGQERKQNSTVRGLPSAESH